MRVPAREVPASPPPFAGNGEYLPGLPMPQRRREQQLLDGLTTQVRSIGLDPQSFRGMVDHVLAKHGKLEIASTNTDVGRDALRKAQEACFAIAAIDKRFWFVSGVDSIYESWRENDWRGDSPPYLHQLVEHAGLMKAGLVTCQRKDKQSSQSAVAATVMTFEGNLR